MRFALLIILLFAFPATAVAEEREAFYGTWGTAKQCARLPIKDGGTVLAQPFEIRPGWLKQGEQWCRVRWFPIQTRDDGLFTGAQAQCGEDSVRDYLVRMELAEKTLTIRWGFFVSNGPLMRCPMP